MSTNSRSVAGLGEMQNVVVEVSQKKFKRSIKRKYNRNSE